MIFGTAAGGTTLKDITVFKNGLGEVSQIINKFKTGAGLDDVIFKGGTYNQWLSDLTVGNKSLQKYLDNTDAAKISTIRFMKAQIGAKASTIGLTVATTALNIAMGVLIPLIIGGLVVAFDKLITTSKEATENLESAKSELESISGELESAKSKYSEVSAQITKLNSIKTSGDITAAQIAELDRLQMQSDELENQIWLLEQKKALGKYDVSKAEKVVWDKANSSSLFSTRYNVDTGKEQGWLENFAEVFSKMNPSTHTAASSSVNAVEGVDLFIDKYKALQKQMDTIDPKSKEWTEANEQLIAYTSTLSSIAKVMFNAGAIGEDAFNKIKVAISSPSDLLVILNDEFSEATNGAELTGEALVKLSNSEDGKFAKAIIDRLVELGYIAKPTATELEKLVPKIEEVKNSSTDAANGVTKLSAAMSNLKTTSSALSSLQAAYSEFSKNGSISFSTLADIQENFSNVDGKFGIDLSEYIDELASGEISTERFKEILSDLSEAKIRTSMTDEQIVNSGENVVASMLRENKVTNANAKAQEIVAQAKNRLSIKTKILAGDIGDLITNLDKDASAAGLTKDAYVSLLVAEIKFENNGLDLTDKINALRQLNAEINGVDYSAIDKRAVAGAKRRLTNSGQVSDSDVSEYMLAEEIKKLKLKENPTLSDDLTEFDYTTDDPTGGGGGDTKPTWLEKYNEQIELEVARLESARDQGLITEKEYWQSLEKIYTDGYDNFKNSSEAASLDEKERLDTENALREKYHEAHVSAYENEVKELDHSRAMNVITEEQYFAQLTALYNQYYAGQDEYREEAMEAEEELYDKRVELVEKWADAAKEAIEAVGEATEGMVSAMTDFIEGAIDTHEENFNLEKSLLQHSLDMNYITEEEYYNSLEELYQGYFASKYLYMEQYWENQEEIYKFEQQQLEDGASAVEDIHAQVVEMIKQEKEDAIDAIDETRDKYLDLIEIRRKALRDLKDEEDYEKERSEKLASVTELERQLNALSYDTSAAGVRKYKEIYAQLQEAKNELSDLENERSYDLMDRALDDEENAVNDKADGEIDSLNKALQDNEALVAEAWERMNGMDAALFAQLDEYNKQHSTSIKDNITEPWNEAKRALTEYGDAYQAMVTYNGFTKSIGQPGMTDGEYAEDAANIEGKIFGNWTEVSGNFLLELVKVGAGFISSFAGIVGTLSGNPYVQIGTGFVSSFAGLASGGAGMLGNILSMVGGFASGTNRVSKTGLYRTDELGDELKFIKRPEGNYRILTEGSKVIDAESTERLMRVINNPDLLTRTPVISFDKDVLSGLSNAVYTDQSKQLMNVSNVFNITSSEPKGVASEIEKLMPKIANYTINKMTNKSINSGFKPPVKGMA